MNISVTRNAKEVFDLLHDDLAAIEREFGRDTVSDVRAITEIGEYLPRARFGVDRDNCIGDQGTSVEQPAPARTP